MAASDFFAQLKELGHDVTVNGQYAVFPFIIPIGSRIGEVVQLALFAPADYPLTAPPGPHISPAIPHPGGATQGSPLGPGWIYWSRPFANWAQSSRDAKAYMTHIRRLFEQL